MPSTRRKVYADNETEKNKRIYLKMSGQSAVTNVNMRVSEDDQPLTSRGKRKINRSNGKSPEKKIQRKKESARQIEDQKDLEEIQGNPVMGEAQSKNNRRKTKFQNNSDLEGFEFEEDGQIMKMHVEHGEESYAGSSDEEIEVDQEISFRQSRSRSRSRSQASTAEHTTESEVEGTSSQSSQRSSSGSSDELEAREQQAIVQDRVRRMKEMKMIEDRQKRISELDQEMKEKLQQIQDLMQEGGLNESASFIEQRMLQSRAVAAGNLMEKNRNENSSNLISKQKVDKLRHQVTSSDRACDDQLQATESQSEETIYRRAVRSNRGSSSSDEPIDTSDELIAVDFENLNVISPKISGGDGGTKRIRRSEPRAQLQEPRPSTSRMEPSQGNTPRREPGRCNYVPNVQRRVAEYQTPEQIAERNIKEAEMSRATVFLASGNNILDINVNAFKSSNQEFINTARLDEDYITVGNHVDDITVNKIKNSEYVDFGKLIPKDRILAAEDQRLELVVRAGHTYYVLNFGMN